MQVIQDGVGDHFENGAYYEIINFGVYSSVIPLELLNFGQRIHFWGH